jgi:hypothetical protein
LVVVEAVVVTFPENERYEMPTPCVLNWTSQTWPPSTCCDTATTNRRSPLSFVSHLELATCLSVLHCHCHPYLSVTAISQSTGTKFHLLTYSPLGASTKQLRRLFAWSCVSACLSVCPHGTTRLQLDKFAWNLYRDFYFFVEE